MSGSMKLPLPLHFPSRVDDNWVHGLNEETSGLFIWVMTRGDSEKQDARKRSEIGKSAATPKSHRWKCRGVPMIFGTSRSVLMESCNEARIIKIKLYGALPGDFTMCKVVWNFKIPSVQLNGL
ncbi:uncharacterized protein RSE6_01610 [Rhynchosporium secalis]|uniref:Uncharacterized protein n=1 Tax=Rhynchosporium secalis TaxID=38038 RepID=A0A1E1LY68_RHYSE|nr:uncharacterized protein RSE6_01610 [Rhynchosporium secalis]